MKEHHKTTNQLPVRKQSHCLKWVYMAIFLVLAGQLTFIKVGNGDFWMHIAVGRWIVQHKTVPHENLFSYTARHYPWADHSWLTDLVLYGVYRLSGIIGVEVLIFACVALSFGMLWWLRPKGLMVTPLLPLVLGLAIFNSRSRYFARPEIFTAVALGILLGVLSLFREKRLKNLWWLPLLFCVWANFHGGVMTAWLVLGIFTGGEFLALIGNRWWGHRISSPLTADRILHLAIVTILCVLAACVNPYGLRYFEALSPGRLAMIREYVSEWQPLPASLTYGIIWDDMVPLALLGLLVVCAACRKPLDITKVLLTLFLMGFVYISQRQRWVACQLACSVIMCAPAAMAVLEPESVARRTIVRWWRGPVGHLVTLVMLVFLLILSERQIIGLTRSHGFGIDVSKTPFSALRFAARNNISGRIFNVMGDSGYLSWTLTPTSLLFTDATNAYGEEVIQYEVAMIKQAEKRKAILDRWGIDWCLLASEWNIYADLGMWFHKQRDWALVYWDGTSVIFLKRIPRFSSVIRQHEYLFVDPTDPSRKRRDVPTEEYVREIHRGIASSIPTPKLYDVCGTMLLAHDLVNEASSCFKQALDLYPRNPEALLGLAQCRYLQGDVPEAERLCRLSLIFQSGSGPAWNLWGFIQSHKGNPKRAVIAFRRAIRLAHTSAGTMRELAMCLLQLDRPAEAVPWLKATLESQPEDWDARQQLAMAYLQLGRFHQAQYELRKMLLQRGNSAPTMFALAVALTHEVPLPREEIIGLLERAVALEPGMRNLIQKEDSFRILRIDPRFKRLAGSE